LAIIGQFGRRLAARLNVLGFIQRAAGLNPRITPNFEKDLEKFVDSLKPTRSETLNNLAQAAAAEFAREHHPIWMLRSFPTQTLRLPSQTNPVTVVGARQPVVSQQPRLVLRQRRNLNVRAAVDQHQSSTNSITTLLTPSLSLAFHDIQQSTTQQTWLWLLSTPEGQRILTDILNYRLYNLNICTAELSTFVFNISNFLLSVITRDLGLASERTGYVLLAPNSGQRVPFSEFLSQLARTLLPQLYQLSVENPGVQLHYFINKVFDLFNCAMSLERQIFDLRQQLETETDPGKIHELSVKIQTAERDLNLYQDFQQAIGLPFTRLEVNLMVEFQIYNQRIGEIQSVVIPIDIGLSSVFSHICPALGESHQYRFEGIAATDFEHLGITVCENFQKIVNLKIALFVFKKSVESIQQNISLDFIVLNQFIETFEAYVEKRYTEGDMTTRKSERDAMKELFEEISNQFISFVERPENQHLSPFVNGICNQVYRMEILQIEVDDSLIGLPGLCTTAAQKIELAVSRLGFYEQRNMETPPNLENLKMWFEVRSRLGPEQLEASTNLRFFGAVLWSVLVANSGNIDTMPDLQQTLDLFLEARTALLQDATRGSSNISFEELD
jgi:hypothetical protein